MADITMCKGTNCRAAEQCLRFNAKANPERQAYFVSVPGDDTDCFYFWKYEDIYKHKEKANEYVK